MGHYGGFDRLAARAVIKAKKTHPEVTLTLLLPYHPAERPMAAPEGFDRITIPIWSVFHTVSLLSERTGTWSIR